MASVLAFSAMLYGLDVKVNLHPKSASQILEGRFHMMQMRLPFFPEEGFQIDAEEVLQW